VCIFANIREAGSTPAAQSKQTRGLAVLTKIPPSPFLPSAAIRGGGCIAANASYAFPESVPLLLLLRERAAKYRHKSEEERQRERERARERGEKGVDVEQTEVFFRDSFRCESRDGRARRAPARQT